MALDHLLRQRTKEESIKQNGVYKKYEKLIDPDFVARESPLTVLLSSSPHIRAIYHIFIAILIILLLDTLIYDLVEHGKINIGINVVMDGFGDVERCIKLWVFVFSLALAYYPGLMCYGFGANTLRKHPAARPERNKRRKYTVVENLVPGDPSRESVLPYNRT